MITTVIRINADGSRDEWDYSNRYPRAYNLASHIVQTVYNNYNFFSVWFEKKMDEVRASFHYGRAYIMWSDPVNDNVVYMVRYIDKLNDDK